MRFTLIYRGPLPANGDARTKHVVRRQLPPQLKHLFTYPPLSHRVNTMLDDMQSYRPSIIKRLGQYRFAPVVSSNYALVAAIELLFLHPEPPGRLITQGGDIDDRLKTLFDALRMPRVEGEIPNGELSRAEEAPFFCLLEDDTLITAISVKTDVLLEPMAPAIEVHLFLRVRTEYVNATFINMGL